jgi:hypothetical protein
MKAPRSRRRPQPGLEPEILIRLVTCCKWPALKEERRRRAEQRKLEAERERLAAEKRAAAEHLDELRAALDEASSRLDALVAQRPGSMYDKYFAGGLRPGTLKVRRLAQALAEHLRDMLARGVGKSLTAEELVNIFESGVEGYLNPQPPHVSLRQYLGIDPPPPSRDVFDESTLLGRMALQQHFEENARPTAEETSEQILAAGRKWGSPVLEPEPPASTNSKRRGARR